MKAIALIAVIFSIAAPSAFALGKSRPQEDPQTVAQVNIERYLGLWHQIAFFPNRFQKGCTQDTTAEYSLLDDGKIRVINECTRDNGERKVAKGKARVVDVDTNAKLKVRFFWLAPEGDYWILDLGENYEYSLVGTPDRKYLWILSRERSMDSTTYDLIVERARAQGFDVSRIEVTGEVRARD